MPEVNTSRIRAFATPADFWQWLAANHATEPELWLKIYKKASGTPSVDWNEAVIEALCWGWIDGVKKSLDNEAFLQRFTPRRAGSNWSKRNCEHVERLLTEGRNRPAWRLWKRHKRTGVGRQPTKCVSQTISWQHWQNAPLHKPGQDQKISVGRPVQCGKQSSDSPGTNQEGSPMHHHSTETESSG